MISLASICDWNDEEVWAFQRRVGSECGCQGLSVDQRRVQVLEADKELTRLKDRVRKASSRLSAETTAARPSGSATRRHESILDVQWDVTAEQLAEHLCFWLHTSVLVAAQLTDCLKELTTRRQEPPASKRALTLVWWSMEEEFASAAEAWLKQPPGKAQKSVVRVTVSDILPLYVWEVDLLRDRPNTRSLCEVRLSDDLICYQHRCGQLSDDDVQHIETCQRALTFRSRLTERVAASARSLSATAAAAEVGIVRAHMQGQVQPEDSHSPRRMECPPPRRRLDESLVTEIGESSSESTDDNMQQ